MKDYLLSSHTRGVRGTALNWLVQIHIPVAYFEIESAIRATTDPGFVMDRGTLATKVGEG